MSVVPTPDPLPAPEPAEAPAAGLGALTPADLANRADKAFAEHLEGYTASTVLHRMYMDEVCREAAGRDEAFRDALDLVFSRLEAHHTATRTAWRQAYDAWAAAAAAETDPDGRTGPAKPPSGSPSAFGDTAAPFADGDDGRETDTDF